MASAPHEDYGAVEFSIEAAIFLLLLLAMLLIVLSVQAPPLWLAPLLFERVLKVDIHPIDRPPPRRMPLFIFTGPLLKVYVPSYAASRLLPYQLELS